MKPRDYCCCAIPTVNIGIYTALIEQFILGILVGTLALATPHIVGASVPSMAPWILAIISYAAAGVQVFGLIGVMKEKSIMFRRYTTIHIMVSIAAFAVAAVWIAISATRHNAAASQCLDDFFTTTNNTTGTGTSVSPSTSGEGSTLCNIFTWVIVGVMAGLWVILAIMQFYLYVIVSSYGTGQRRDHEKYEALHSFSAALNNDIPMTTNRGDAWDARPSLDEDTVPSNYAHVRSHSSASVSTILGEKQQQPREYGYSDPVPPGYPPTRQGTYSSRRQASKDEPFVPPQRQPTSDSQQRGYGNNAYVSHPSNAYTQEPGPTPHYYNNNYYSDEPQGISMPQQTQTHPAEGSFGRKRPRVQRFPGQGTSTEFDQSFFSAQR